MFADSCVELTNVMWFVLTWASGAPLRSHIAAAPAVNPVPVTCTSSVTPWSPNGGFAAETVGF
jgi:hypothetical protein